MAIGAEQRVQGVNREGILGLLVTHQSGRVRVQIEQLAIAVNHNGVGQTVNNGFYGFEGRVEHACASGFDIIVELIETIVGSVCTGEADRNVGQLLLCGGLTLFGDGVGLARKFFAEFCKRPAFFSAEMFARFCHRLRF